MTKSEKIKAWQSGWFGKKISTSCLGGIMSDIERKSHTPVEIDRFFPSTQLCPSCGKKNKHGLEERTYHCECGYFEDRDVHAAKNILREGLKKIGLEQINTMPEEIKATTLIMELNPCF